MQIKEENGLSSITLMVFRRSRQYCRTSLGAINATIEFADNFRVTSSGLELHVEMNGTKLRSFELVSQLLTPDG